MFDLFTEVLPIAIAIALSPFPIIPTVLLLLTPSARANSLSFLAGWAAGIFVATWVFVVLASVIEGFEYPPVWASWTRIVLGLLLVGFGGWQWVRRGNQKESPAWMQSIDSMGPGGAARLGLVLSAANPKVLLLAAVGGLAIGNDYAEFATITLVVFLFTAVAVSTVATPVVGYLVVGERALGPLRSAKNWLEPNSAVVMAVVIAAIGVLLVVKGASALG
ncbi:MAG: GAP family protein [Candidatus Nanopelagicales bacterium]|nr:GAP family protein [Candidatus Nanopelagicales bacterium]